MEQANKHKQIEFDVFQKDKKSGYSYLSGIKEDTNNEPTSVHITLSHQSVIVFFICLLMFLVVSFTLGVEKGKLVAKNTLSSGTGEVSEVKTDSNSKNKESIPVMANAKDSSDNKISETKEESVALEPQQTSSQNTKTELTPTGGYSIQVASLKTENSAKELSESLSNKGLVSFTKASGDYYIVLAGRFKEREEAKIQLKELKKTFNDCFIRKI